MSKTVRMNCSEKRLIEALKDILCCPPKWAAKTYYTELIVTIDADSKKVQRAIYEWLSEPERLKSFGGDKDQTT